MRVTHTEFCGAINHATSYPMHNDALSGEHVPARPMVLPINPGDGTTFPWLSGIATRFEKYKFTSVSLTYRPTCSTLENGGLAICPILDPNDPVPDDRHTLMNAQNTVVVPVFNVASSSFPRPALRPTDTMYIREKSAELMDPAERRTTDLGYFAVLLTDTDVYDSSQVPKNYGDVFITYTVELSAPRARSNVGKGAFIGGEEHTSTHLGQDRHHPVWHRNLHNKGPRALVNNASTLNVFLEHQADVYKHAITGHPIDYSAVVFKEPFEGVIELTNVNSTEQGTENTADLMANGRHLTEHNTDVDVTKWALQTGAKHQHRFCKIKPLRTIRAGLHKVKHTVKVVAQAGETLALAMEHYGVNMNTFTEALLSEVPEELLNTLPLLLAL